MDDAQDPGPAPSLPARTVFVFLVGRMDAHDQKLDDLIGKLDDLSSVSSTRYADFKRSVRRSDYMTIALAVGHGIVGASGYLATAFVASYVAINHTWYFQRIAGWAHGAWEWVRHLV